MTDVESRLARVEERIGGVVGRLDGIDRRIDDIAPTLGEVATLNERVGNIQARMAELHSDFAEHRKRSEARDETDASDKRQFNRWAIGLSITILLALLSLTALVLTAGVHG